MRVLVTGACGLLGAHVMTAFSARHQVVGIDRHAWWGAESVEIVHGDLQSAEFRARTLDAVRPDVLVHCAAATNVEWCEQQPAEAYALNASVTRALAELAGPRCLFVYVSTDSVFDGRAALRTETDAPCPPTVYGRSKLHGEWEVQLAAPAHLILRTNFFGWSSGRKRTFGEWLYRSLQQHEPVTLFTDVFFTPVYVVDLAESVLTLVERGHRGLVHAVGADRLSKFEFGMRLAALAGFDVASVRAGSIDTATLSAPRPKDMSLSSARFAAALGRAASAVDDGLSRFIADAERPLGARVAPATA
jgi:dTDP-4-dehydrorhamnose reductase